MMIRVYLALGSNLSQPLHQVNTALAALTRIPDTSLMVCSSFYRTKPLGPPDQPDFLNAVVALDTLLPPEQLLEHTQKIEHEQGRVRTGPRWGPRTLDLDIMLYGDQVIATERLTVPHYGLKQREFMLYPLAEIAPDLVLPDGESVADCLKRVPKNGMALWHMQGSDALTAL
jgi:2-amino-4-hydroxy-6-hydroxymethyldihydropteridine diphosphokinase